MTNTIKDQFMADMQLAGLVSGTQARYLGCVNVFFKETWLAPHAVTECDVQQFLIALRDKDMARETFCGYRSLRLFQMAEIIFDATVAFRKTHRAELGLRYCEQMVQAAPALDRSKSLANLRSPTCRHHIFPLRNGLKHLGEHRYH
ncbi:MAG TPA: hypothetical protein ENN65_02630 [Candidatus Hydrogenedentes bacterium]|nr:hypothetical protein [Candidatus Hydrogenedentota bacterium]